MIAGLILFVPLHYCWRLLRLGSPWPRLFLAWAGYCSGARVERIGTPLKRDVFYISNHCSWIDILAIAGAPKRYVYQGVHMMMDADWGTPWKDGEKRSSKLVFIGRSLDADNLKRGFEDCLK